MKQAKIERELTRRYFLNDYYPAVPRLRIELKRGGNRTIWQDKTTLGGMEEAKKYLDNLWLK